MPTDKRHVKGPDVDLKQTKWREESAIGSSIDLPIELGGEKIPMERVEGFRLEQAIDDHHVLELDVLGTELRDLSGQDMDYKYYADKIGQALTIGATISTGDRAVEDAALAFTGILVEVRFEHTIDGMGHVILVAKSPTIAMDGPRQTRAFVEMSASDIISKILGEYEITVGTVESAGKTMPWVLQNNQSDWDFIQSLATSNGLFAYYDGAKLHVQKAQSGIKETLKVGVSLATFSVGMGLTQHRFGAVAFNSEKGSEYRALSESLDPKFMSGGVFKAAKQVSESLFNADEQIYAGATAADQKQLDTSVSSHKGGAISESIRCRGKSDRNSLKPGMAIKVEEVGAVSDVYFIERIVHMASSGKYFNEFVGSNVAVAFPRVKYHSPRVTGIQTATVIGLADPQGLGRIKVKFRALGEVESHWIRYVSTHAGDGHGWMSTPEIGDEVLVGFEHGNPAMPVAFGSLYHGAAKPSKFNPTEENNIKGIVTRTGNKIFLDDTDGSEKIEIITKDEANSMVLDVSGPSITITSKGDISLSGANITIDASEKLTLKSGSDTEVKASANLKQTASANAELKANANVDIQGSAQVNVKGGMINLN